MRSRRYSDRYVCTLRMTLVPAYTGIISPANMCTRILPHIEVEKSLKNLAFFGLSSQGEYTYTTPLRIPGIWP